MNKAKMALLHINNKNYFENILPSKCIITYLHIITTLFCVEPDLNW